MRVFDLGAVEVNGIHREARVQAEVHDVEHGFRRTNVQVDIDDQFPTGIDQHRSGQAFDVDARLGEQRLVGLPPRQPLGPFVDGRVDQCPETAGGQGKEHRTLDQPG